MKRMLFCFVLGVAAGAGGYWYFQQDAGKAQLAQARTQVVAGAEKVSGTIKDTIGEISVDDIKTKLLAEPGLSALAINVDTTDGLVTLSGKVDSHEQIAKAVKLAMATEGVHKVISTLQVNAGK